MSFFSRLSKTLVKKTGKRPRQQPADSASQPKKQTPKVDTQAASQQASQIIFQAQSEAREVVFSAKEEAIRIKSSAEEESRKLRSEIVEIERRVASKEESLENRLKDLQNKEASLQERLAEAEAIKAEIEKTRSEILVRLQKVAGLSLDEAKEKILAAVEERARNEAGKLSLHAMPLVKYPWIILLEHHCPLLPENLHGRNEQEQSVCPSDRATVINDREILCNGETSSLNQITLKLLKNPTRLRTS